MTDDLFVTYKERVIYLKHYYYNKDNENFYLSDSQISEIRNWQTELRSGTYEQGHGLLCNQKKEYCCLGVYAHIKDALIENKANEPYSFFMKGSLATLNVDWLGERTGLTNSMYTLNDGYKFTFPEIADFMDILIEHATIKN